MTSDFLSLVANALPHSLKSGDTEFVGACTLLMITSEYMNQAADNKELQT